MENVARRILFGNEIVRRDAQHSDHIPSSRRVKAPKSVMSDTLTAP
jgi:hypothetical protein